MPMGAIALLLTTLAQPMLLERTLALVGGQAITLSDARAAIALGLIEIPKDAADPIAGATSQLVDRELVLREVQRYAPVPPSENEITTRLDEVRKRLAPGNLASVLKAHGFTEMRLRTWLRDDLRTQTYLVQRFASATAPTDIDVSAAYLRQRAEFDKAGLTFEQAAPILRDRLVAARRAELVADWLSELRRRTDVVIVQ